jgi:hypothetical protein
MVERNHHFTIKDSGTVNILVLLAFLGLVPFIAIFGVVNDTC